ncbi:MAG: ATP-binding protein, partial [Propionibacteriaceae bacterium]
MEYLVRTVDRELDELLPDVAAIALDGPKGVGKTATARRRAAVEWRLDDPAQRDMVRADFGLTTAPMGTLLIDEWQHLPQVWDAVRRQIDAGAPPGQFLLTGSATPVDAAGTHSGAGRILSLRMRPMALHERGVVSPTVSLSRLLAGTQAEVGGTSTVTVADYVQAIVASGFPGITAVSPRARRALLDSYLQRVIDRDLPDQGFEVRRPETLRRWLAAYAAASSTTTSYSKLLDATTGGDGTQPAKTTTMAYREHLSRLWLLDP